MSDLKTASPAEAAASRESAGALEAKWGKDIVAAGWTAVPNILLQRQQTLGLTPTDLNILLQLLMYWWQDGKHPYPSKKKIAESIGVSTSTVQRRIRVMEAIGFLERRYRRQEADRNLTNEYDLTPLVEYLMPHAAHEVSERQKARERRNIRQTRVAKLPSNSDVSGN
ncbi:helix-turn-helix domain-containing protein [Kushneria phosphatilytica]|uniref:Helix-turn-helix domain-containing protein n=1 Tax=Kushneria phosphatilytica TaxID=657387 RepID=A0A5C1A083_9GAMM|nr:helix-turn-helix domain-containing protein [Kushneria phosphatilytica]QEL12262.1 helix-turn-helix domain-containing protein [Kushneria phosphatilytica]